MRTKRSGRSSVAIRRNSDVSFDEDTHTIQDLIDHCEAYFIDRAIMSPGFSLTPSLVRCLEQYSIPLCSEIELGWSRFKGKQSQLRAPTERVVRLNDC